MKALLICTSLFVSSPAFAQALQLPEDSPAATVTQTVGLTEITVAYHRPAVKGRAIWGKLVPYGEPWRAGANENTLVTVSTDVKIGGKPLRAGTYGLHMIPTAKDWTIAFSTATTAWGSFTYDPKEDALRVTVTPRATAASEERLSYRFDDPSDSKATLVLSWEKLAVPIVIEVENPKIVMANVRGQLRGQIGFSDRGWAQAAGYWFRNGGPLDEALKMVDRAIQMRPSYSSLMLKANILEKQGNAKGAAEHVARAQGLATEAELNQAAYGLMNDKKIDESIKMFQMIVQKYPESWNAQDSLGEALAAKGDKAGAVAAYTRALALTNDPVQKKRIEGVLARLK
jgi:hypothetical protein